MDSSRIFAAPRSALERKPPHGAPCNRCGLCCMAALCKLGQRVFGLPERPGPCPALVDNGDGSYDCGIIKSTVTDEGRDAARLIIGAGDGCDARFNGEPINHAFNMAMRERDACLQTEIDAAHKLWGIK